MRLSCQPHFGTRRTLLRLICVVLFSHFIWASGPWTNKSYKEWSRGDLSRILHESPWVKRFTLTRLGVPEGSLPGDAPTGIDLWHYPSMEAQAEDTHSLQFAVKWVSSRTLREAWARGLVLQKKIPENELEKHLPPRSDEIEIAVEGPDMTPFQDARETTLKAGSYLAVESKRVGPTQVVLAHSQDGKMKGILFYFPRRGPTGEPTISSHARRVEFVEHGSRVEVYVTFTPQTMIDQQGIDL